MELEKIIRKSKGKISVDWEKFFEVERSRDEDGYQKLLDMLKKEKVLTFSEENSYMILAGGLDGSPLSHGLLRMYFPEKDDALRYASAKYSGAMYEVRIAQFVPDRIKKRD
jgi:hypothetical protein